MSNHLRPDVIENKRLEKNYDLEAMSYEDVQWLFHDFVNDVLLTTDITRRLSVSSEVIDKSTNYNKQVKNYLHGIINAETLNNYGTDAWIFHDQQTGNNQNIIRFVLTGLYDEKKGLFDEYGSSMHIELLVSLLFKLGGASLCKEFSKYIDSHPRAKIFLRKSSDGASDGDTHH
jgi:hypothetical protein